MRRAARILLGLLAVILFFFGFLAWWQRFGPRPREVNGAIYVFDRRFGEHTDVVREVAFSPDGSLIASGSVDGRAIVRRRDNGALVYAFPHPYPGVTGIDMRPDGRQLATAAYDGKIRIWDLTQGRLVRTISDQPGTVWTLAFSPDGKRIVSGGEDRLVKVWDAERGERIKALAGHTRNIWAVDFSPDGRTIASGSYDFTIRLWDVATGALRRTLKEHSETVVTLDFTRDGRLVSGSDDMTARLWSPSGDLLRTFEGSVEHVQAIAVSPDDKWLLTGGRDKSTLGELAQNFFGDSTSNPGVSMRLWDLETGELLQTFTGHANDVNDVAFSPDGKWIISASSDHTIGLWRRKQEVPVTTNRRDGGVRQ